MPCLTDSDGVLTFVKGEERAYLHVVIDERVATFTGPVLRRLAEAILAEVPKA